ncbi:MAG: CocE/NonD family hydrolase [Candidatus Hydrogenedentes bacterium]|nr:CocE/NonD family hydrolase [Candidatus Hydrogenedentota bacterium]
MVMRAASRVFVATVITILIGAWHCMAETVMVPMRDGTKLATDYFLPSGDGPFPVVVARSPYPRKAGQAFGILFGTKGMAFVIQDTRGRGDSEGKDAVFGDDGWGERQDGVDTIQWVKQQKWCNGKVGTFGMSALAITSLLCASAGEPLTCQVAWVGASQFYGEIGYNGGVFLKSLAEMWTQGQGSGYIIDTWKSHPTYDAFWQGYNMDARASKTSAPALHVGGWWDIFATGTLNAFVNRQHKGGKGSKGQQYVIIGPWGHGIPEGGKYGELPLKDNYKFDLNGETLKFLDYYLTDDASKPYDAPAVRYYTIGDAEDPSAPGNEWRTADDWPPFPTTDTLLYLRSDKSLQFEVPGTDDPAMSYTFDPTNPCPTKGGANLTIPAGSFDQRELESRPDVLSFASTPLETPIEITGDVRVRLYVSTDAPDTDFTAKLLDIYPDGRAFNMLDGIRRLKFRKGYEKAEPLPAGEVGELLLDLGPISLVVNKGHRIGIQVSSSNYPRYELNPNTGADFPTEGGEMRKAINSLHLGKEYPSALILPARKTP